MRSEFRECVIFLVALLLAPIPELEAQDQQPPSFSTAVDIVNVTCTVKRGNHYVTDLTRDDFEVYEDGSRQQIQYFALQKGAEAEPLNMVLLIDTSGSVKDKLMFEQQAAGIFLEETLRPKKDLAAVIQFDSDLNLVQDFTDSINLLTESIGTMRAGGSTKLYDAIWVAVEELREQVGRRILVILSDGADTDSMTPEEDAIRTAQNSDCVIYGIGVRGARFGADFGKLKDFAQETGGEFYDSKARLDELRLAFSKINQAILNQYSLGYTSTNPTRDGSFREIEVKVKGHGLKLNYRKGYYAPKSKP